MFAFKSYKCSLLIVILDWSEEVELLLGSYIEERQLFTMHIESLGDGQPASVKLYLGENEGQSLMNLLLDRKLARTGTLLSVAL